MEEEYHYACSLNPFEFRQEDWVCYLFLGEEYDEKQVNGRSISMRLRDCVNEIKRENVGVKPQME